MIKRVFVDVAIGLGLAIAGQMIQFLASLVGPLVGVEIVYESAPADGSMPEALLGQVNAMFWLAGVGMLVLSFLIGLLVKVRSVREGASRGAAWLAVVALSQLFLALANATMPIFGVPGIWAYFAAVLLGPVLAGLIGERRRRSTAPRRADTGQEGALT